MKIIKSLNYPLIEVTLETQVFLLNSSFTILIKVPKRVGCRYFDDLVHAAAAPESSLT